MKYMALHIIGLLILKNIVNEGICFEDDLAC